MDGHAYGMGKSRQENDFCLIFLCYSDTCLDQPRIVMKVLEAAFV
jgi:hypothetical protein